MKKAVIAVSCCMMVGVAGNLSATEMILTDSGVCTGVAHHTAVDLGDVFQRDIGKLFCFFVKE